MDQELAIEVIIMMRRMRMIMIGMVIMAMMLVVRMIIMTSIARG